MVWALPGGSKGAAHVLETVQTCRVRWRCPRWGAASGSPHAPAPCWKPCAPRAHVLSKGIPCAASAPEHTLVAGQRNLVCHVHASAATARHEVCVLCNIIAGSAQGTVHIVDRTLRAPALATGSEERPADQADADDEGAEDPSSATEPQDADAEIWDAARDRARAEGGGRASTGRSGWQAARRAHGERVSLRLMSKRWAAHASERAAAARMRRPPGGAAQATRHGGGRVTVKPPAAPCCAGMQA